MRLVTHVHESSERPGALVEHDGTTRVVDLAGVAATTLDILTDPALADAARAAVAAADPAPCPALDDVRLAPPVRPGQVLAVGYNYEGHRGPARDGALPQTPNVFVKTRNALSGPHDPVVLPRVPAEVDYEGEIAIVVGRRMQDVPEAEALDHVAGYTLYDDVTARDWQHATSQWTLGKNFDGFGQLGPAVVTVDEAGDLTDVALEVERDGVVVATASTSQMVFPPARLLHLLSQVVPLEPGDVVATGSAAKTAAASAAHVPLADGDAVTITATGLGSLTTRFVAPGAGATARPSAAASPAATGAATTGHPSYGGPDADWARLGAETLLGREPSISPARKWRYEDGLVLDGIREIALATGEQRYLDYVTENIDAFVGPDGEIHGYVRDEWNLDHVNNGKAVLSLWEDTGDERYRTAALTLLDQLEHQPRLDNGSFWHKEIYPRQMWLDGLYMGSVFYARAAHAFDRPELLEEVVHQFLAAYDASVDPVTGLCRHAFDETRSMYWADPVTGHSPHVWLRALGWFAMAMVDTLEHLPADLDGRDTVHANLVALLEAVQRHADPSTNLWHQIPDQPGRPLNYLESSGSLMILTAIAKSLRTGLLAGAGWETALETGWAHATEQFLSVTEEGWVNVHRMCEVAGLGGATRRDGSYAYYMSEPVVTNDHKGVGPFLLLAAEMHRR